MKITKTQIEKMIEEVLREHLDEVGGTSRSPSDMMRRRLIDLVHRHGKVQVFVKGQKYTVDRGSIDPEDPDTLYVVSPDGQDHEISFADVSL